MIDFVSLYPAPCLWIVNKPRRTSDLTVYSESVPSYRNYRGPSMAPYVIRRRDEFVGGYVFNHDQPHFGNHIRFMMEMIFDGVQQRKYPIPCPMTLGELLFSGATILWGISLVDLSFDETETVQER